MLGEAQDVLLAAETSLARHQSNRRGTGRQPTEDVPHCVTCYCLDNRQLNCTQRCSSTSSRRRRHSSRRNTTVDELLRQMSFDTPILSDEDTYMDINNEVEDVESRRSSRLLAVCPAASRCATAIRASSYCEVSKTPETTDRSSCERWPPCVDNLDNTSQIRSTKSDNIERSEQQQQQHSDGSKRNGPSDRKNSRRLQQMLGAGDRNAQLDEPSNTKAPTTTTTDADEDDSSQDDSTTTIAEESHIRELKLVRWQFIERIHDEVSKLHRLQRHLDLACCSPPLTRKRSVSTMTSARLLSTESNVSGQFYK